MKIVEKENARSYIRKEGIKSYLLSSALISNSELLTTTLVEIDIDGIQRIHNHFPEQIYFILEGFGQMTVGNETQTVEVGDCIFIPSNEPHGLVNGGNEKLIYFSVAAPLFTKEELINLWPLQSEEENK